jgi:hypothetical protein
MRNILFLLVLFLVACVDVAETTGFDAAVPRADSITCNTAYRPGASVPIEREETFTLADEDAQQKVNFNDLVFHAKYNSGRLDNERALRLWVTEPEETAEFNSQLYQFPLDSGPVNQFTGGHGFTGLNYVYHPSSNAELQFWCVASEQ